MTLSCIHPTIVTTNAAETCLLRNRIFCNVRNLIKQFFSIGRKKVKTY